MATSGGGANARLESSSVWFDQKNPTDIMITIDDPDLFHPVTGKPGLILKVSSNPRSANFDPKTFNTLRGLLQRLGKPHPADEADESIQRRLDRRFDVIGGTPPPARDPERPQDDRWDANAVRYILSCLPELGITERWTRGVLMEHLRGQRRLAEDKIERARAIAASCGVECRTDPDDLGGTVHFFRTDPGAPDDYPASAAERRARRSQP